MTAGARHLVAAAAALVVCALTAAPATAMTPGYAAGNSVWLLVWPPLPSDATRTTPWSMAYRIAASVSVRSADAVSVWPSDMLITPAPLSTA